MATIPPVIAQNFGQNITSVSNATYGFGFNITNSTSMTTNITLTDFDPVCYSWFAFMGVAAAIAFSNLGAAYGTAKSGIGIGSMAVTRPNLVYKSLIPIVMAGILGIYGLIVAVILQGKIADPASIGSMNNFNAYSGYKALAAGLCCGLSSMISGYCIGVAGEAGVRGYAMQSQLFVGMILILIFAEAIGLYGLIVAIILSQITYG